MNVFVFDIETVPDVEAGRRLHDLAELDDRDVAEAMFSRQRARSGNDFLRHHLQRVVAISVALRSADRFTVWSLGEPDAPERELIQRFFEGIETLAPTIVSWNGSGFDLPVLHYRALLHGVMAPRYWDTGEEDQSFRRNNYLGRYHERHTDLMEVLAGYQPRAFVPLDEMATMLGFPGKLGMDGSMVWDAYQGGEIGAIRAYCETDVLNTYLVYLRFELMRGRLALDAYDVECEFVRSSLATAGEPHLASFVEAWREAGRAA